MNYVQFAELFGLAFALVFAIRLATDAAARLLWTRLKLRHVFAAASLSGFVLPLLIAGAGHLAYGCLAHRNPICGEAVLIVVAGYALALLCLPFSLARGFAVVDELCKASYRQES